MINSACNAPACFMAWKIAIMSRGVAPRAFSAEATFSTVGNSGSATMAHLLSVTSVSVRGVTTVVPVWLNGLGCETSEGGGDIDGDVAAGNRALEIRMPAVATMVPVRSLMMMRAGVSGVTSMLSSRAMKSTGEARARRHLHPHGGGIHGVRGIGENVVDRRRHAARRR